mgnify:CR=1 FL=1
MLGSMGSIFLTDFKKVPDIGRFKAISPGCRPCQLILYCETGLIVEAQGIFLPKDIIPAAFRIGNPSHLFLWEPGLPEGRKVLFIMNELLGLPHTKGSRPILLGAFRGLP